MNPKLEKIDFTVPSDKLRDSFELQCAVQRTLIMHQVKIKNIEKWDNAKATDFIKNKTDVTDTTILDDQTNKRSESFRSGTGADQSVDFDHSRTTLINEEIKTIEHAPMLFQQLREFDNITDA